MKRGDYLKPIDIDDVIGGKHLWDKPNNPKPKKVATGEKKKRGRYNLPIYQYTLAGEFIRKFDTIKLAAEELGIMDSTISRCANGTQKTAGGYIWKREYVRLG